MPGVGVTNRTGSVLQGLREMEGCAGTRIYFGAEFCQHLLPSVNELSAAYRASKERGLDFTFVSPPITDKGLETLNPLLAFLSQQGEEIEVVINDWGVLRTIHQSYPSLEPVFGRLMNKMLRDPRITPRYDTEEAPEIPLQVLQQSGFTSLYYQRLLKSFRVERVELDNLYQGINIDLRSMGLKASIHIPWGYVTTGRICLFGSLNHPRGDKFTSSISCQKECEKHFARLKGPPSAPMEFTQRGNTLFYKQEEDMVEKALSWAEGHEARVVYQPLPLGKVAFATDDSELMRIWIKTHHDIQKV